MASLILLLEELDGLLALAVVGMDFVLEQVGQDLQEVRLAGAEEPGNPDAHLAGDVRVVAVVDGIQIPRRTCGNAGRVPS